jgi:hypothetical protein
MINKVCIQKQIIEKNKVQTKLNFKITQNLLKVIHPKNGCREYDTLEWCMTHLASMYRCWKPSIIHNAIHDSCAL